MWIEKVNELSEQNDNTISNWMSESKVFLIVVTSEVLRSNSNYHANIDEPLSGKKSNSTKLFIERFQWMTVKYLIKKISI